MRKEARDVLTMAFGEDGKAKREKVFALKENLDSAWDKDNDGTSRRDLEVFLSSIVKLPK